MSLGVGKLDDYTDFIICEDCFGLLRKSAALAMT